MCYYLDNKKENEIEIRVPENENGEHHVLFFKRQDSCHEMHILGFEIEDGAKLLKLPDAPTKKIEVYGDSVSAGEVTEWDFNQYTPQVVVVAIGQNDNHPFDYMSEDYMCEKAILWREHYTEFLKKLRQVYPKASIVCCTTLLEHDSSWDKAIDDVVVSMGDRKISHCIFKRNGAATPGHLRIPETYEMARELADYIENLGIEEWK